MFLYWAPGFGNVTVTARCHHTGQIHVQIAATATVPASATSLASVTGPATHPDAVTAAPGATDDFREAPGLPFQCFLMTFGFLFRSLFHLFP